MSDSSQAGARASGWELAAALLLSLLVIPPALFTIALGASGDPSPDYAIIFGFPIVVWGIVVLLLVLCWRGGRTRLWRLPLVAIVGVVFWPVFFFLISSRIRRSVLPSRPAPLRRRDGPGVVVAVSRAARNP